MQTDSEGEQRSPGTDEQLSCSDEDDLSLLVHVNVTYRTLSPLSYEILIMFSMSDTSHLIL